MAVCRMAQVGKLESVVLLWDVHLTNESPNGIVIDFSRITSYNLRDLRDGEPIRKETVRTHVSV